MTPEALEKMCEAARKRIAISINKSAAQHLRRIREQLRKNNE